MTKHLRALTMLAAVALAACQTDRGIAGPDSRLDGLLTAQSDNSPGAVYALTNQVAGNSVAIFERAADGSLTAAGSVATGGTGTGAGLGSQGAVTLSRDGRWLLAVNAGSNDVSVFRVGPQGLSLTDRVASGGTTPISVTTYGSVVYVLNAGGAGNITGFTLDPEGGLTAIAGSTRPLSGGSVGPAQVSFSPKGDYLVVTEKATSRIDVYTVDGGGLATGPQWFASAGATPFGFAFGHGNELFVSEAAGSASSYALGASGLATISAAVATNQGAPCWLVVTKNGKFAYTANAQGGSISGFAIAPDGSITLLDANGATAIVGRGATDLALSESSQFLYQLIPGNIVALAVQADGHLSTIGSVGGLPAGTVGLAAR
jgi:6-phosphogluconolactonase (cycloisomerase 2 family)